MPSIRGFGENAQHKSTSYIKLTLHYHYDGNNDTILTRSYACAIAVMLGLNKSAATATSKTRLYKRSCNYVGADTRQSKTIDINERRRGVLTNVYQPESVIHQSDRRMLCRP